MIQSTYEQELDRYWQRSKTTAAPPERATCLACGRHFIATGDSLCGYCRKNPDFAERLLAAGIRDCYDRIEQAAARADEETSLRFGEVCARRAAARTDDERAAFRRRYLKTIQRADGLAALLLRMEQEQARVALLLAELDALSDAGRR